MARGLHPLVTALGGNARSDLVTTDRVALHAVTHGRGPTVVLLHGFPQDCYSWRRVIGAFVDEFRVIAVDLRGVGASAPSADGYAAPELAADIASLITHLELGPVHVAGHDVGGWVAYALALAHPDLVRTATLLECTLPGIEPPDAPPLDVPMWHIGFHQTPGLPETLLRDHRGSYFGHFLSSGTATQDMIGPDEVAHYAAAYGGDAGLHAALAFHRATPATAAFNAETMSDGSTPLLVVGGEESFGPRMPALAEHLRSHRGFESVDAAVVRGARHYLADERPSAVAALIADHVLARRPQAVRSV